MEVYLTKKPGIFDFYYLVLVEKADSEKALQILKETQNGDIRRRDHLRGLLADEGNPRHGHAARVMESYAKEWLSQDAVLNAIMNLVGLFDRPATSGCLRALRREPVIAGLTEPLMHLSEADWNRAVYRLREARLLLPKDEKTPDSLNAHPLVREWFGARLQRSNEIAWRTAHDRIYEYLREQQGLPSYYGKPTAEEIEKALRLEQNISWRMPQ